MALIDIHNLSSDGEFRVRFIAALVSYVKVVFDEDPMTPNHAERLVQAVKVLNAPMVYGDKLALGAAAAVGGQMPDDATMMALVAGYWTILALAPGTP